MPIYEYVCCGCGSKFELLRPFSQANEASSCLACLGRAERTISACASFSKSESGESVPLAGSGSACGSCSTTSCSTCGS